MGWFKAGLKNSVYGLLGAGPSSPTDSVLEDGIEDIREAMLRLLGDNGAKLYPQITRRVRYAADIQALWYLRGDLMGVLASLHGESKARENMQPVTQMFQGLLPGAMASRPSPLM